MDDEDAAGLDALQHLTGAEFESGDVHERRGCNEPAPGVEAEDGREASGLAAARTTRMSRGDD